MSNFAFLKQHFPQLFETAAEAEASIAQASRTSCFNARYTLERAVTWLYAHDPAIKRPYSDNLGALIHEPTFKAAIAPTLFPKVETIQKLGNMAAHSSKPVTKIDALQSVKELFHFCYWLHRTYTSPPHADVSFDFNLIPQQKAQPDLSAEQLQKLQVELEQRDSVLAEKEATLAETQKQITILKQHIEEIKKQNQAIPDPHDYSEAETRDYLIDVLLKEAGWDVTWEGCREYPVQGMPNEQGEGFVDYVLWGDDGLPLAVVEAKRTRKDPRIGQQQAKLYADCLEKMTGQRPIIFYSNGYDTYLWDDLYYPPRKVQGFYKKDELDRLIKRRGNLLNLSRLPANKDIAGRYYQIEAIKRVGEAFQNKERKSLIVMATGTGKTRVAISLVELLQRAGWIKRVLFLADRNPLLRQAKNAFKAYLPQSVVKRLGEDDDADTARIVLSTYPAMMNAIDEAKGEGKRFSVGHFDLVIIDEAHRSVYKKFRAIFEYFDSLLIGLTATPRNEVDKNTYSLFELETGVPTYAYELEQAVADGFLVPPRAVSVPLHFQRDGIKYDELSPEEQEEYEDTFLDEETGELPRQIMASALNTWLFNQDTVDKVLGHLMSRGLKVEGGDRLGKTILFAANHKHATYIQERFDACFPHLKGTFTRVIDNYEPYAQSILDDFSVKNNLPVLAISVDMLDTGIDVPEVLNLVFFKLVRSRTKFNQMIGRGTRLCENLLAPGENKKGFLVFDYCQNFEFFAQRPEGYEAGDQDSLSQTIFKTRLSLAHLLNRPEYSEPVGIVALRDSLLDTLHETVDKMNPDGFQVRPYRRLVDKYQDRARWDHLNAEDVSDISKQLSGLPSDLPKEEELSKRFDLLLLRTQLSVLEKSPEFERFRERIKEIAGALEGKASIPMVANHLDLIQEVRTDAFWEAITLPILEEVRKKLRELVIFLDKKSQPTVFVNFTDTMGEEREHPDFPFNGMGSLQQYKKKVEHFIRSLENNMVVHKLRTNKPITRADIEELESILFKSPDVESKEKFVKVFGQGKSLGEFIRSLVGLDRCAAKEAFGEFVGDTRLNGPQITFINQVVEYLTQNGVMNPEKLYEEPFSSLHDQGVEGLFDENDTNKIISTIRTVNLNAQAA